MQSRPVRAQSSSTNSAAPLSATLTAALSWTTNVAALDDYLRSSMVSESILKGLADIPLKERISILRGTVNKQPTNPDSWLHACIKRYQATKYTGPQPVMHGPPLKKVCIDHLTGVEPVTVPLLPHLIQQTSSGSAEVQMAGPSSELAGSSPQRSLWAMSPKRALLIPAWVQELHAASGNKSQYVKIIYNQLDPLRLQRFSELSPAVQYHIAMSVMLTPIAWANASDYVAQCMMVYSRLENPGLLESPMIGLQCPDIRLIIVHVNAGIGDGHISVHAALVMLKKIRPATVFTVKSVYSFCHEAEDGDIEKAVIARLKSNVQCCGSVAGLPQLILEKKKTWLGCKILFVSRFPLKDPKQLSAGRSPVSRLHTVNSRDLWKLAEAIAGLEPEIPCASIAHLTDFGSSSHLQDFIQLDPLFGKVFQVSSRYYGGAPAVRYLRATPEDLDLTHFHASVDPCALHDGWCWMGNYDHEGTRLAQVQPTTQLNANLVDCIVEAVFDRAVMNCEQLGSLLSFRMEHVETGAKKYMGRSFWHAWSGWAGTPLQDAIDERYPCLKTIMSATGETPPPNCSFGEECGSKRFCSHCEKVLKLLSPTWRVPLMADVLIAWMTKSMSCWADGNEWQATTNKFRGCLHQCGPTCPLNPDQGV